MPQVKDASPQTAMMCSSPPLRSRAFAIPSAAESAVPHDPHQMHRVRFHFYLKIRSGRLYFLAFETFIISSSQ